jgi:hypothetical protein
MTVSGRRLFNLTTIMTVMGEEMYGGRRGEEERRRGGEEERLEEEKQDCGGKWPFLRYPTSALNGAGQPAN